MADASLATNFEVRLADLDLSGALFFGKDLRVLAARASGLTYDTRFTTLPKISQEGVVFILVRGTMMWSTGETVHGPALLLGNESHFPGVRDGRARNTYILGGDHVELVEVRGDAVLQRKSGDTPLRLTMDEPVRDAAAQLVRGATNCGSLMTSLRRAELLRNDSAHGRLERTDLRVWQAFQAVLTRWSFGETLDRIGAEMGHSARQARRDFASFAERFNIGHWAGYREMAREYRLRLAVILLAVPSLSLADVARHSGYSCVATLQRALREAGLPSATDVRFELLQQKHRLAHCETQLIGRESA